MRVLICHNDYRSRYPSGENHVVTAEVRALRAVGVEVTEFRRSSDDIASRASTLRDAATGWLRSPGAVGDFYQLQRAVRPDVVHVHNVFPLISPWVVRVARDAGVPVIQTVHNYRHTCVAGTHFRKDHHCSDCLHAALPYPAVMHACYRGSRVQSAAMAVGQVVHRGTWDRVDRFLALSTWQASHLRQQFPGWDVRVKPNFTVGPPVTQPPDPSSPEALFVGRLDTSKGVRLLLEAWTAVRVPGAVLHVVGSGPLASEVAEAARRDRSIRAHGRLEPTAVAALRARSRIAVVPSLWPETFGQVAVEALAAARPVLATAAGGLSDIVDDSVGWRVTPAPEAVTAALRLALSDPAECERRGAAGRQRYLDRYTPERIVSDLLQHYRDVARLPT